MNYQRIYMSGIITFVTILLTTGILSGGSDKNMLIGVLIFLCSIIVGCTVAIIETLNKKL